MNCVLWFQYAFGSIKHMIFWTWTLTFKPFPINFPFSSLSLHWGFIHHREAKLFHLHRQSHESHIHTDTNDLYSSHHSEPPWSIYLIDSKTSHTICMAWAVSVLKKNPATKTLLLTLLPGITPATLAGTDCRRKIEEMQWYSTHSARFTGLFHPVFQ